jgi:hypothetical protein
VTDLNPEITPAGPGKVRMTWTPDPACFGYRFYVNDHPVSKSTKPSQTTTTFAHDGQPTAYGIAAAHEKPAETVLYPAPSPPAGKPPAVRTNYAAMPLGGQLDPLWAPDGKHAGPGATIDIVEDPLGQKGHVQRHVVQSGSILWGGDRCEVMTHKIGGGMGARIQLRFSLLLPAGFKSDGGGWNSVWQFHYPNDGPLQPPIFVTIRNGNELWLRIMAPVETNQKLATLAHGAWNTICQDIFQHDRDGFVRTWLDGSEKDDFSGQTLHADVPNTTYWKQGFYRPPNSSSGTQTMYFTDTLCWYENTPDAMLGWTP